jgi:hypothetical protein
MQDNYKLNIDVDNEISTIRVVGADGGVQTKMIKTIELGTIFSRAIGFDSGPLFCSGVNTVFVHRIIERGAKTFVFVNGQALVRTLNSNSGAHSNLYLPGVLMSYVLRKNETGHHSMVLGDTRIVAYNTLLTGSNNDMLYHMPFGNVYNDGRICWGGNRFPKDHTYRSAGIGLIDLFFGSVFNGHITNSEWLQHSEQAAITTRGSGDPERLFKAMELLQNGSFPYNHLILKNKMTYKEFISLVVDNDREDEVDF